MDDSKELMVRSLDAVVASIEGFRCETDEQFTFVVEWKKKAKATREAITAYFKPLKAEKKAALDEATKEEKGFLDKLVRAENAAAAAAVEYNNKKVEARRKEEERLRKEAEDKRLAEAERLASEGKTEKADELLDKRVRIDRTSAVAMAAPKVAGVSFRTTWSAEVTDLAALIRAVAVGQAPMECLQANQVFLNEQAREKHESLAIDGVRAVPTQSMATR